MGLLSLALAAIAAGVTIYSSSKSQDDYKKAQKAAELANIGRYRAMLKEVRDQGTSGARDIMRQFKGLGTRTAQNLQARGLAGTTIGPSLYAGQGRERANALNELGERVRRMKLDVMNSRTDSYPNAGAFYQTQAGLGSGMTSGLTNMAMLYTLMNGSKPASTGAAGAAPLAGPYWNKVRPQPYGPGGYYMPFKNNIPWT